MIGMVKANLKFKIVIATKQATRFQPIPLIRIRVSDGRRLSCQAKTPVNTRNTEKMNPNPLKKSQ